MPLCDAETSADYYIHNNCMAQFDCNNININIYVHIRFNVTKKSLLASTYPQHLINI